MSQSTTGLASILRGRLDEDRLTARLQRLVRAASENPPGNEAPAAELAAAMCEDAGLEVTVHEAEAGRPNVSARLGDGGRPRVVFCSHLDVVPAGDRSLWERDPYAGDVAAGRLHGRGSADAKGPCAAAIEAAGMLAAEADLAGTLELLLVADEEAMGSKGAGPLVSEGVVEADAAIVGEPTSLQVVRAQRGACWLRVTVRGRAAHGSAPERGRNAILHMAEILSHLPGTLPPIEHPVLGGPSLNVGTIRGGEKINIVPASCAIEIDRRTLPGEAPGDVIAAIESAVDSARLRYPDLQAEVDLELSAEPFEIAEDAPLVTAMAEAVREVTGSLAALAGFRGASDARFFAQTGIPVIVCGPGDISLAHTARESVDLGEVRDAALAYACAFAGLMRS